MKHSSTISKQSGFTLIEIMVVVAIIAVLSVAVALSLGGNNDRLARWQADRFMAVVNEVRDEAVIAGDNFALVIDEKANSYQFEQTRDQASNVHDSLFKVRSLDQGIDLEWEVFEIFEGDQDAKPKVFISSLGEITPFEARFEGDKLTYLVTLNDDGNLQRATKNKGL